VGAARPPRRARSPAAPAPGWGPSRCPARLPVQRRLHRLRGSDPARGASATGPRPWPPPVGTRSRRRRGARRRARAPARAARARSGGARGTCETSASAPWRGRRPGGPRPGGWACVSCVWCVSRGRLAHRLAHAPPPDRLELGGGRPPQSGGGGASGRTRTVGPPLRSRLLPPSETPARSWCGSRWNRADRPRTPRAQDRVTPRVTPRPASAGRPAPGRSAHRAPVGLRFAVAPHGGEGHRHGPAAVVRPTRTPLPGAPHRPSQASAR
jgi:hypothetical protein